MTKKNAYPSAVVLFVMMSLLTAGCSSGRVNAVSKGNQIVAFVAKISEIGRNAQDANAAETTLTSNLLSGAHAIHQENFPASWRDSVKPGLDKALEAYALGATQLGRLQPDTAELQITRDNLLKVLQAKAQHTLRTIEIGQQIASRKPDLDGTFFAQVKIRDQLATIPSLAQFSEQVQALRIKYNITDQQLVNSGSAKEAAPLH